MIVTELKEISAGRFLVSFSDDSEMKLGLDLVTDFSLYSGRELSEEEKQELLSAAGLFACKERALRMIGARPLSCGELYDKLVQKGETPENAEECIHWLRGIHYLDDENYAGMVVRHYAAKGYGVYRIKNELYRRKVPKELWDEALLEMPETDDTVYNLLCRRLKSETPDRAEMKRATDALYRRGFSWDEIKSAVSRFQEESLANGNGDFGGF
jgi:regulatory protein